MQCCQLKEIQTLPFFIIITLFASKKAQQHLELDKNWSGNLLEDNKHENSSCIFTGLLFTAVGTEMDGNAAEG